MNIGEGLKYLYKKFILRDLLSYILPGILPVVFLYWAMNFSVSTQTNLFPDMNMIEIFALLLLAYTNGHIISSIAKMTGKYNDFPDAKVDDFLVRIVDFKLIENNLFSEQRERYVVLKQFYRNMGFSILIVLVISLIYSALQGNLEFEGVVVWIFGLLGVIAFYTEFVNVREQQKILEEKVIESSKG